MGLTVFKAGGELLSEPRAIAQAVAALAGAAVFVHGGGPQLDAAATKAGLVSERVAGRRVTSPALIELAIAEWRGRASVRWVQALSAAGAKAVGLCGADGACLRAVRRPPKRMVDDQGHSREVDFGEVGDVTGVDADFLRALLPWAVPVLAPLAMGPDGRLLNVNADTVAAEVAVAMGADALVLWTGAPGLLADPDDVGSLLHQVDGVLLKQVLDSGAVRGGMLPKLAAVQAALAKGVPLVQVGATRFSR